MKHETSFDDSKSRLKASQIENEVTILSVNQNTDELIKENEQIFNNKNYHEVTTLTENWSTK